MEKKIKQVVQNLKIQYVLFWLVPVILLILFETNVFNIGIYADDPTQQYIWETAGILIAIGLVPLSLKLFSVILKKKIDQQPFPVALKQYLYWSTIRLAILEIAVLLNILVYYFTLNNVGGLCALLALTASIFCLPSEKRLREELNIAE